MLIQMGEDATPGEVQRVRAIAAGSGRTIREVDGAFVILSDTDATDLGLLELPAVAAVSSFQTPYRLVHRSVRPEGTRVRVGHVEIGGDAFVVAAGPCAVEDARQLDAAADRVAAAGASMLRGGAFKPRTSPYMFQGLHRAGLELLSRAGRRVGLPVVTEVLATEDVGLVADYADMLQIGARNMQNVPLLRAVGSLGKPVLLKRGLSATVEELLLAAEYIALEGNLNIVLCERGIRTFETATRNTLDLGAAALLRDLTHLPVIVDPSHASGRRELVPRMSVAAAATGVSGLLVEVHPHPEHALCDGPQSIPTDAFPGLMAEVQAVLMAQGRRLHAPSDESNVDTQIEIETARLRELDAALVRMIDARVHAGLRIGELRSRIGRPPAPEDDAWGRKVMEIHAAV
jgi:3-deoxy-7-phosphoheptulonate synthase